MNPRPYQSECLAAIIDYLERSEGNPCAELPTGAGKTPCMAWAIQYFLENWPSTRILVLAHVRELLLQGVDKLRAIWPSAPIGIYSAGLKSKEAGYAVTYASIQSIHRKAQKMAPFDLIFVDEAHRIPLKGETTYRNFLNSAKEWARLHGKPYQRVIGWTATPYRLDGGPICGPGHILTEVAYKANVADLIQQGYLCRLTSKSGQVVADVSNVHKKGGEFDTGELAAIMGAEQMVTSAIDETLTRAADRKAIIFFCVNVSHAQQVSDALDGRGLTAPVIHAGTPPEERANIIKRFTAGELRGVCNVNVLSEGFDAQRIDCVVLLRPTASPGLFYQQVGRGLRLHPSKHDCLILDFSGNTERHGPIDSLSVDAKTKSNEPGEAPGKTCPSCPEIVPAGSAVCRECGYEWPKREAKHDTSPAALPILSEPELFTPVEVDVQRIQKDGKPPTLRVIYWDGRRQVSEFICLEHGGYASCKANHWWFKRFGDPVPATVDEAMYDLLLASKIKAVTTSLTIKRNGKYYDVVSADLKRL